MRPAVAGAAVGLLLALAPAWAAAQATAQEEAREPLVTDRPDATESAETVAPGRLQLESGYSYQRSGELRLHQVGEVLLRVGAVDRVEVRVGIDSYLHEQVLGTTASGWGNTSLGLKWKLLGAGSGGPARPDLAMLVSTTLPTGTAAVSSPAAEPEVRLASAWELPGDIGLGANVSWGWVDDERRQRFGELGSSVALGIGLTDALAAFVEHFGTYPLRDGLDDENFVNGGVTVLLGPDAQLDARLGHGLNGRENDVFVGFGSAFRW